MRRCLLKGLYLARKALTHWVCDPSFCSVSRTVGTSRSLSVVFRPIQHVESMTEAVGERNHSDWLFSLSKSVHEKRNGSEQSSKRLPQEGTQKDCRMIRWDDVEKLNIFTTTWPSVAILTTTTCCHGELFPLMQAWSVCASWPLAVVFAVYSSATFWPRHRRRNSRPSWH